MQVSDHGAGKIGPQEGPVSPQPRRSISPATKPLADGVEGSARTMRKTPNGTSEIKKGLVHGRISAIESGKVGQVAVNSRQTQVLPRTKAAPINQPATSASVDKLRAAAQGLTRQQVVDKLKGTGANDTSAIDRLRAATANMSHEEMAAKVKGLSTPTPPAAPPQAAEQKDVPPKGKEELADVDLEPDEEIVIYDDALGPQPGVARETPKPNPIKAALNEQLFESKEGVRGALKPEAERKELSSSLALGYKLTGATTEQLMTQLKAILTDSSSKPHEKEFALDTLKSWVDQRVHQKDLENKETMTAFKELIKVVPADRQAELFAGQASPLTTAKKPSALSSMREAQDPAALMKRVQSGRAKEGDVLAAATAIREQALNRYAMMSPSNIAQGNVLVDAKRWNTVDQSVKQSVKTSDAFNLHFKNVIDGSKNAKEAGNVLRFYYETAAKLADLGDFDSAFNLQNVLTGNDLYQQFKGRFGAVEGGWDGFTDKYFGSASTEGSSRKQLEGLAKPFKNFLAIRAQVEQAGPGRGIMPMALISKDSVPSLADAKFTTNNGLPDIEQLRMTKKAVLDPLLKLQGMGQANRTTSHPLNEFILPQALIDQASAQSSEKGVVA